MLSTKDRVIHIRRWLNDVKIFNHKLLAFEVLGQDVGFDVCGENVSFEQSKRYLYYFCDSLNQINDNAVMPFIELLNSQEIVYAVCQAIESIKVEAKALWSEERFRSIKQTIENHETFDAQWKMEAVRNLKQFKSSITLRFDEECETNPFLNETMLL